MRATKTHADRLVALVAIIAGVVALFVGWRGVWHYVDSAHQMPYILSGGIVGIFLIGLGALLWVSSDLHHEGDRLDTAARHLETTGTLPPPSRESTST